MDIGLLSKMLHELLLGNDKVGLPGMGSFIAELVPATFTDKGYAINPPYRRVVFLPGPGDDGLLAAHLARIAGISEAQALEVLQKYLAELKAELIDRKTVVFPGLGRLRATRQNNFFFICDEDLDIYPEGFGLQSVSLKSHTEALPVFDGPEGETATIVSDPEIPLVDAPADLPASDEPIPAVEPVVEPAVEPVVEPAPEPVVEPTPEPAVEPVPAPEAPAGAPAEAPVGKPAKPKHPGRFKKILGRILVTILVLAAVAAVALATFLILVQAAPDFIDSILYTPEELRIINW
ncbi:MAG: hypothetical protein J5771_01630 [Bacteroidales bacterium]|nr:hypothetical protein [Bacteroidales bacterium]